MSAIRQVWNHTDRDIDFKGKMIRASGYALYEASIFPLPVRDQELFQKGILSFSQPRIEQTLMRQEPLPMPESKLLADNTVEDLRLPAKFVDEIPAYEGSVEKELVEPLKDDPKKRRSK